MAKRHEAAWRSADTGPRIHGLGTRRRLVVSFRPRTLCPQGKKLLASIKQEAGRTQEIIRKFWRKEKSVAPIRNRALVRPLYSP